MRSHHLAPLAVVLAACVVTGAQADPVAETRIDSGLQATVEKRLLGDRTGACFATAVIEGRESGEDFDVRRSYACADGSESPRIGRNSAFEIGSVSKTMTATLLAGLIEAGHADLDDPLADYLPEGAAVPEYEGRPILLRHVVTHTSGLPALPPGMPTNDPTDPYRAVGPKELLDALGHTTLTHAPGTRFEYSNFASMLLSYAVAQRAGEDLESLLDDRLFTPLGMEGAYVNRKPEGVAVAVAHLPNTQATPAWQFRTDVAGVGGVHATLDDMVRYVEGHLGAAPEPIEAAMAMTREPIETASAHPVAMNWMLAPLDGRKVHVHEGGTGGFSSFVAFDHERRRGVVVLSDTALTSLGGLGSLGQHLLDARLPLGKPRKAVPAPAELVDALAGEWELQGGMKMTLRRKDDALTVQAQGQPEFEMGHDSAGDFYPLAFDALLSPQKSADGSWRFNWHQDGGVMPARRVGGDAEVAPSPSPEKLREYAGRYPLGSTGMTLSVREQDGTLFAQATGQGAFPLTAVDIEGKPDVFEATAFGIEIRFRRGDDGRVTGLSLLQGGQTLQGERQQ